MFPLSSVAILSLLIEISKIKPVIIILKITGADVGKKITPPLPLFVSLNEEIKGGEHFVFELELQPSLGPI